jgi:hypothetical protein
MHAVADHAFRGGYSQIIFDLGNQLRLAIKHHAQRIVEFAEVRILDDLLRVLRRDETADGNAEPHNDEIDKRRDQDLGLARPDRFAGTARRACLKLVALWRPFESQARTGQGPRRIRRLLDDLRNGFDDGAEILGARIRSRGDNEREDLSALRRD